MDKDIMALLRIAIGKLAYLVVIVGLLLSIGLPFARPVYALTSDEAIQGEGGETDGVYLGASDNYTNLNSNDNGTTYLRFSSANQYHCYNMQDFAGGTITSVTITYTISESAGTSTIRSYTRIGGVDYLGDVESTVSAAWVTKTYTWANNPSTGVAWTTSGLNAAEFGIQSVTFGAWMMISYLKITVNYSAGSVPTVTTSAATSLTTTSATLNGNITDDGGATITNYGFVWDTVSRADPGNTAPWASAYSDNWTVGAGTYAEGAITHATGAILAVDTIYYCRAAALNSVGWDYGDEVVFETIGIPTITTQSASDVASTMAQLNGLITNDNGQESVAGFAWAETSDGPFANWAAIVAAPSGHTDNATGTWATGEYPYLDIGSLSTPTVGYTFMARASNDAGVAYGAQLTFTTSSGVGNISSFTAIPTSTTISLAWIKGTGASNTFIRYSVSTYPSDNTSGTLLYAGTSNSYLVEDLTPGTNHYFSGWGLTAGVYSDNATMVMATTLAPIPTDTVLPTPATPSSWNQTPSVARIANVPFYSLVNYFADSYEIPNATMWYGLSIMFSVAAGFFIYWRGNKNLFGGILVTAVGLGIGAVLGLTMLWVAVFFCVIALAWGMMTQRWP